METGTHQGPILNPFLNHLVIENILKYTHRPQDIKSLRLLCHNWNDLVSPKLMGVSTIYINSERKMRHYLQDFHDQSQSHPLPPPHKNFHLKLLQSLESTETDAFLKFMLTSAEELHLSKCVMSSKEILDILKSGGNLKTLSFNEVLVDENAGKKDAKKDSEVAEEWISKLNRLEVTTCDEGDSFPWSKVFCKCANLQVLHAQLKSCDQVTSLQESMLNHPLPLTEFSSFLLDFDSSQINLLSCLELPLKILDLSISSSVNSSSIENLLLNLKHLENLKLFHETDAELNAIILPPLRKLKSLELMGDPIPSGIFSNVWKSCGNLRHLNLSQVLFNSESEEEFMKFNFIHENLSSLSVEEGFLSPKVVGKLASLFPKLRKVCLFLNDENIGVLFKEYNNLEEIIVLGTELTDLGIIGVSPNRCGFIGNCKKLRKFSLYPQPQQRITDMTIHHGLIHVPELISVELPETVITNEGLKFLMKNKPNLMKLSAKPLVQLSGARAS